MYLWPPMEFLYPGFLYALAALAIPIIVHLFNFRRFKKIAFTNVRFLREIKLKTQSQNQLRHLLILLMRLLAVAFLVFAFAQPFIPNSDSTANDGTRAVSVFIDNSFSMEGETEAGSLLETAKNRAIDIAMAYEPTDRFLLLTNDFEGRHQRYVSRQEFVQWVQEVEVSPQSHSLREISTRQNDPLKTSGDSRKMSYLVSDFQKSQFDLENFATDTTIAATFVVLERNSPGNLYIDSVWFNTPVRKLRDAEQLNVRIRNAGRERVENVPLKLAINGNQSAVATFAVEPGAASIATLSYINETPGFYAVEVSIEDYPITFDDSWHFGYRVFDKIIVQSLRPENANRNDVLKAVFSSDSVYHYTSATDRSVDYANLANVNLMILNGLTEISTGLSASLVTFVKNGGSLFIIPSAEINADSYNAMLNQLDAGAYLQFRRTELKVKTINLEHPVYKGVFEKIPDNPDLPTSSAHFSMSRSLKSGGDDIMAFANGAQFLSTSNSGTGKVYTLAVPIQAEYSNFARHALFVATTLRIAELSQNTAMTNTWISAESYFTIPAPALQGDAVFKLRKINGQTEVIPQHQLRDGLLEIGPGPDINVSGNYILTLGIDTLCVAGLNYSRSESNLDSYMNEEIKELIRANPDIKAEVFDGNTQSLTRTIAVQQKGTELWKWCLFLVLAFLLLESLLIRFWNKRST